MPKGTIKNQAVIADDGGTTHIFNTGIVYLIEPEGDSNLNPPDEVRFISTLDVSIGDIVFFHHLIVANNHIAVVYAKYTTGENPGWEQQHRHKLI
jgi:hypothetical protein